MALLESSDKRLHFGYLLIGCFLLELHVCVVVSTRAAFGLQLVNQIITWRDVTIANGQRVGIYCLRVSVLGF